MPYDVVEVVLASDVADAGTFTTSYPNNRDSGDYEGGSNHKVVSNSYGELTARAGDVSFSFGASEVTVTNNSGTTLASGTTLYVEMDRLGADSGAYAPANPDKMAKSAVYTINLGAPDAAD